MTNKNKQYFIFGNRIVSVDSNDNILISGECSDGYILDTQMIIEYLNGKLLQTPHGLTKFEMDIVDGECRVTKKLMVSYDKNKKLEIIDHSRSSSTEKLVEWIEDEKQKGLIDVKFSTKDISNSTVESFAREVNEMIHSPSIPDPDLI